ncbi:MAG: hypothetical protein M3033_06280 [Acidobacteriota bacterium]|nr:hypothetical protein [Acidobacteriota bacterium]
MTDASQSRLKGWIGKAEAPGRNKSEQFSFDWEILKSLVKRGLTILIMLQQLCQFQLLIRLFIAVENRSIFIHV